MWRLSRFCHTHTYAREKIQTSRSRQILCPCVLAEMGGPEMALKSLESDARIWINCWKSVKPTVGNRQLGSDNFETTTCQKTDKKTSAAQISSSSTDFAGNRVTRLGEYFCLLGDYFLCPMLLILTETQTMHIKSRIALFTIKIVYPCGIRTRVFCSWGGYDIPPRRQGILDDCLLCELFWEIMHARNPYLWTIFFHWKFFLWQIWIGPHLGRFFSQNHLVTLAWQGTGYRDGGSVLHLPFQAKWIFPSPEQSLKETGFF
jgi:hypothetical protein